MTQREKEEEINHLKKIFHYRRGLEVLSFVVNQGLIIFVIKYPCTVMERDENKEITGSYISNAEIVFGIVNKHTDNYYLSNTQLAHLDNPITTKIEKGDSVTILINGALSFTLEQAALSEIKLILSISQKTTSTSKIDYPTLPPFPVPIPAFKTEPSLAAL